MKHLDVVVLEEALAAGRRRVPLPGSEELARRPLNHKRRAEIVEGS
jgi:hypothetical protein